MITLYGASDDLVEIEGINFPTEEEDEDRDAALVRTGNADGKARDELDVYKGAWRFTIGQPEAVEGQNSHGIIVTMRYGAGPGATWGATIDPIDEGVPCPWAITSRVAGYSTHVSIDAPDGTPVRAEKVK